MNYILGIPCVNRVDLLRRAINSVRCLWPGMIVIDNTDQGELSAKMKGPWPIWRYRGLSPLTFSQSMNLLQAMSFTQYCEVCFFMHSDGEAHPGTAERLLAFTQSACASRTRWGIIFTHYDVFCAFNVRAWAEVGPWDTNLPQYFSDNDYYRRLRLAGFEMLNLDAPVTHHEEGSGTIRNDRRRKLLNDVTFPLMEQYYARKWGGPPGRETYSRPFNSKLFPNRVKVGRTRQIHAATSVAGHLHQ